MRTLSARVAVAVVVCALWGAMSVRAQAGVGSREDGKITKGNSKREPEGMTEHYLSGGKRISVVVYEPAKAGKYPAVVVLHGSNGPMSSFVGGYGQTMADQGYVVAFVHYFDRTGTTAYPSIGAMEKNFPEWIGTVKDAISFLDKNPKVDSARIGLFGTSLGGFLSTSVSSADPRVKAVVDVCGGIPESLAKQAKRLAPTLILHGDSDMTVPVEQAYQLEAVLKRTGTPYEKEIYPGEGHMLRGVAFDAMARAFEFLNEQLMKQPQGAGR